MAPRAGARVRSAGARVSHAGGRRFRGRAAAPVSPRQPPATWALALLLIALPAAPAAAQRTHLLVVSGIGGTPEYADTFYTLGARAVDAARSRYGLAEADAVFLAERPERDPRRIAGRSTRAAVTRAIEALARRSAPGDEVLLLFIGHGSAQGGEPRLNLPGPDLTAADLAALLDRLAGRRVAVVNTASASGGFVPALKGEGRLVVTATRSGAESNATRFGRYFVDAIAGDGADTDKDGRVSLLEAFLYARREVGRAYDGRRLLQSEHALLDGDGDGEGSGDPKPEDADAKAAATFFLAPAAAAAAAAAPGGAADPKVRALEERKRGLEAKIDALKAARAGMDSIAYEGQLESLLLELARVDAALRAAGGGR